MARLSELIPAMADALKVPEKSVRNAAAVLRLNKLLTTGPRGPGALHMTPTDAANLLLALMYDDGHEAATTNVPRLRAAELVQIEGRPRGGAPALTGLPPHDFVSDGKAPYHLGDVLDSMFDVLTIHGSLTEEPDQDVPEIDWRYVSNVHLSISRPGYGARLWLDARSVHWTLLYRWTDPEDDVRRAAEIEAGKLPAHSLAHLMPFMESTRTISDEVFDALGDALRGAEFDWSAPDQNYVPPYEAQLERQQ